MTPLLILFLISLGSSVAATWGAIRLARVLGVYDIPDERKIHPKPVPYLGGVGIYVSIILTCSILPFVHPLTFEEVRLILAILLTSGLIVAFGVWDDVLGSGALPKLVLQAFSGIIMYWADVRIEIISTPLGSSIALAWASPVLSVMWFVLLMNAVNLIDGLDGLAAGISCIGAVFIVAFGLAFGDGLTVYLALIVVGACLGFLLFNFYPARIFMGDSGSLLLGFLLAVMTMMSRTKSPTLIVMLVPFIALGIPVFDSAYAFIRRLVTGSHPFRADKRHLHHRLMGLGLSHKRVVLLLYYISLYLGLMAFILSSTNQWIILLMAVLLGSGLLILIENISFLERQRTGSPTQPKPSPSDKP